jgi:hypothetical protein
MTPCKGLFSGSSAVERLTVNQGVAGSNPALGANQRHAKPHVNFGAIRIPADHMVAAGEFRTNVQHNFDYSNQDYSNHD